MPHVILRYAMYTACHRYGPDKCGVFFSSRSNKGRGGRRSRSKRDDGKTESHDRSLCCVCWTDLLTVLHYYTISQKTRSISSEDTQHAHINHPLILVPRSHFTHHPRCDGFSLFSCGSATKSQTLNVCTSSLSHHAGLRFKSPGNFYHDLVRIPPSH